MQLWQVLPFVLVIGVFGVAFAMRKKLGAKAAAFYGGGMTAFRERVAEPGAICLVATERKMLSSKLFYVAVTPRRLVIEQAGGDTRSFDRGSVQLAIKKKTFADVGNMQTTYSSGWELKIQLPDGARHTCRVYEQADGIPDHQAQVQALVRAIAA